MELFNISTEDLEQIEDKTVYLGRGGFGVVLGYPKSNVKVAIKQIPIRPTSDSEILGCVDKVLKEVRTHRELKHDHIVRYIDSCIHKHSLFIMLEYMDGGSLRDFLVRTKPAQGTDQSALGCDTILLYLSQILSGLSFLHGHKVIHRDLRCDNILRTERGSLKIADFGIAKKLEPLGKVSTFTSNSGNPYWKAPEIIKAEWEKTGRKADIWSLGVSILEMCCVTPSFILKYQDFQYIFKLCSQHQLPEVPDFIGPEIQRLLSCCLVFEPEERKSAQELLEIVQTMIQSREPGDEEEVKFYSLTTNSSPLRGETRANSDLSQSSKFPNTQDCLDLELIDVPFLNETDYKKKEDKRSDTHAKQKTTSESSEHSLPPFDIYCADEYVRFESFIDWIKTQNPASNVVATQYKKLRQDKLSYEYLCDVRRYLAQSLRCGEIRDIVKLPRYKYEWTWWELNRDQLLQLINGQEVKLTSQCHVKSCQYYWSAVNNVICLKLTRSCSFALLIASTPQINEDIINTEHSHPSDRYEHFYLSGLRSDYQFCSLIKSTYNDVVEFLTERQYTKVCALISKPTEVDSKCCI